MGYDEDDMRVWNPRLDAGGLTEADAKEARFLLWKGHCSVHQRFRPEHVDTFRAEHPGAIVVVHPECAHETVAMADVVGSTEGIIRTIADAPAGAVIGVGTEIHLVNRLNDETPGQDRALAGPAGLPLLDHVPHRRPPPGLGAREPGRGHASSTGSPSIPRPREWARVALDRMLEIT